MEKETELDIDNLDTDANEVSKSLATALKIEREKKKELERQLAELTSAKQQKVEPIKEVEAPKVDADPEKVDLQALVKDTVRTETFAQAVEGAVSTIASDDAERNEIRKFLNSYKGDEKDPVRLVRMAKAAVNVDSLVGDVGSMAVDTGMLSMKSGGARPAPHESEIQISEAQYANMRALGYKDRESMKKALKALEDYEKQKGLR